MSNKTIKKECHDELDTVNQSFTTRLTRNLDNRKRKTYRKKRVFSNGLITKIVIFIIMMIIIVMLKGSDNSLAKEIYDTVEKVMRWDCSIEKIKSEIQQKLDKATNNNNLSEQELDKDLFVKANTYAYDIVEENKLDYGGKIEEGKSIENNPLLNKEEQPIEKNNTKYIGFILPVNGPIGSKFGERVHPIRKTIEFHYGIDIEANNGVPIKASLDGEVKQAGFEKTYGNFVILKHESGFETTYAHCSVLKCKNKQKVNKGDIIALVGDTGASQGPHLHFEIRKNSKAVNPEAYLINKWQQTVDVIFYNAFADSFTFNENESEKMGFYRLKINKT